MKRLRRRRPHKAFTGSLTLVLLWFSPVRAEWTSKGQIETGFTDNALATSSQRQSDTYYLLGASSYSDFTGHNLGLRLNYRDYAQENSNDSLSWGIKDRLSCLSSQTQCEFQLRGLEYLHGEPQTTDSSFSNYALSATIERSRPIRPRTSLDLIGGYELKNYHSLKRLDHTMHGRAGLGYDLSEKTYLEASGELGLALSSESDFSNYYVEVLLYSEHRLNREWELSAELSLRQSVFVNRDLTTETLVTRKNGRTVSLTDTSKESYSLTSLLFEARRILNASHSLGLSLNTSTQKTRSGYQDYNINQLTAQWIIHF